MLASLGLLASVTNCTLVFCPAAMSSLKSGGMIKPILISPFLKSFSSCAEEASLSVTWKYVPASILSTKPRLSGVLERSTTATSVFWMSVVMAKPKISTCTTGISKMISMVALSLKMW